jgi:hypothetical protein
MDYTGQMACISICIFTGHLGSSRHLAHLASPAGPAGLAQGEILQVATGSLRQAAHAPLSGGIHPPLASTPGLPLLLEVVT